MTVPPTVKPLRMHVTRTLVTFASATVPVSVPIVTVQVCAGTEGCVSTVTAYAAPLATGVAKAKLPLALTVRLSPPLS